MHNKCVRNGGDRGKPPPFQEANNSCDSRPALTAGPIARVSGLGRDRGNLQGARRAPSGQVRHAPAPA